MIEIIQLILNILWKLQNLHTYSSSELTVESDVKLKISNATKTWRQTLMELYIAAVSESYQLDLNSGPWADIIPLKKITQ